jgi:hypothetical protein
MIKTVQVEWSAKKANGQESGKQTAEVQIVAIDENDSAQGILADLVTAYGSLSNAIALANRQAKTDARNKAAEAYRREGNPQLNALVSAIKEKAKSGDAATIAALMQALGLD